MNTKNTPLLDRLTEPQDLKVLDEKDLLTLSDELRNETIRLVSKTGGHLGASLGVVELTVALHTVFDAPRDVIIWDVGHQTYPHKILTGRRAEMSRLRQKGGPSGFTKRGESPYDPFGAGHASTSISAALGMAVARDLAGENTHVIAVIGDGAMSGGMVYEALNNAGSLKSRLFVILNDNAMSIAPPTGAMARYLTSLAASGRYRGARGAIKRALQRLPSPCRGVMAKLEGAARGALGQGTLFEAMGFYYIGPVDGHDLPHLLHILRALRDAPPCGPVLLHVRTTKGKGYLPAEKAADAMHGVGCFEIETGAQKKTSGGPSYTQVFADSLIKAAQRDGKIIGITAAMPCGTGMREFGKAFPGRMFDVGIAEGHAVTFAAGLAAAGFKPFVAIYSTFLQRAYDQIIHDVVLQRLPVRFAIDRAGPVGADGPTHAGAYDIACLAPLPGLVLMAPSDEAELAHAVATAAAYDAGPIAFRFPRGCGPGVAVPAESQILEIGRGRIVREGSSGLAILSYGTRLAAAVEAAQTMDATVADMRFARPLDEALVRQLAHHHHTLFTLEEGSIGGFGALVLTCSARWGLTTRIVPITLPDAFQDHATQDEQYAQAGLDAAGLMAFMRDG